MKKIIFYKLITIIFLCFYSNSYAGNVHFIDFKKVLNESIAGKKAQETLTKRFTNENTKFSKLEKALIEKERELISKRKIITKDEYQKQVNSLRSEVTKIQKDKKKSLNDLGKMRFKAKNDLLKKLNPILKTYLETNKIQVVIDKKEVLYGNSALEITDQIMKILNKEVKSLNLK